MTTAQKFNSLITGLALDLNDAFEYATAYGKYSNFTNSIDPENMSLLKLIRGIDSKGTESFNDVARSIMNNTKTFTNDIKLTVVEFYEKKSKTK